MNCASSPEMARDTPRVTTIRARGFVLLCLTICSFVAAALPADMDQELTITFDEADVTTNDGVSVVRGNVQLQQGTLRVEAETMDITTEAGRIVKVVGRGTDASPAQFSQQVRVDEPPLTGTAETITYITAAERLELDGRARIEQPARRIEGGTIHWNAREGRATARAEQDGERVRMIWQPERDD